MEVEGIQLASFRKGKPVDARHLAPLLAQACTQIASRATEIEHPATGLDDVQRQGVWAFETEPRLVVDVGLFS